MQFGTIGSGSSSVTEFSPWWPQQPQQPQKSQLGLLLKLDLRTSSWNPAQLRIVGKPAISKEIPVFRIPEMRGVAIDEHKLRAS